MNRSELEVAKRYEAAGWRVIRGGAPDFLCICEVSGKIVDAVFVEVKSSRKQELTCEQLIWRKVLQSLGAKFRVETPTSSLLVAHPEERKLPAWAEKMAEMILGIDAEVERKIAKRRSEETT
jgi:hypothetical protein